MSPNIPSSIYTYVDIMLNVPTRQESNFTQYKIICTLTFGPIIVNDQIHNLKNLFKNIKMTTTFI
jgi:hypothetical protein